MAIAPEIQQYLVARNEIIGRYTVDIGNITQQDYIQAQTLEFGSEEQKAFFMKELLFVRSIYCHQRNIPYTPLPLSNDLDPTRTFIVSSLTAFMIGFNLFFDVHVDVIDILTILARHVNLQVHTLEQFTAMDIVHSVLTTRNQEENITYYDNERESWDALYVELRERGIVLFLHAVVYVMNHCPQPAETEGTQFHDIIIEAKAAILALLPLMQHDCGGRLALQLIQRYHECETLQEIREYAAACRFLYQFITQSMDDVIPWCVEETGMEKMFIAVESVIEYFERSIQELSYLNTSRLVLYIYVQLLWPKLVTSFFLPMTMLEHRMQHSIISMLLDLCDNDPHVKMGMFVIYRLCYSVVGQLPVLKTLIIDESELTVAHIMEIGSSLVDLAVHTNAIFASETILGLTPQFQRFHRTVAQMTPEQREEIIFDEFYHVLHSLFLSFETHMHLLHRDQRIRRIDAFDLSLHQEEEDRQHVRENPEPPEGMIFGEDAYDAEPLREQFPIQDTYVESLAEDIENPDEPPAEVPVRFGLFQRIAQARSIRQQRQT